MHYQSDRNRSVPLENSSGLIVKVSRILLAKIRLGEFVMMTK